jgi:CotH kinase protein/Secretion system C-terminal sorting domain
MRKFFKRWLMFGLANFIVHACYAQLPLFDQGKVNEIRIYMPPDSLQAMFTTLNAKYYQTYFTYSNGVQTDTIDSVGIRFRGNTSLNSQKKSIKLSIDEFVEGKEYKGVRKLNLIGNHNDPTYVREKLFYHCWNKLGFEPRRISFVNVYINDAIYGIYSNVEEVDKQWLKRVYRSDTGNLYKATWGADLKYLGTSQTAYKNVGGSNRAYDLQTNEAADDYAPLVKLIVAINSANDVGYLARVDSIIDYKKYLKILALDVCTGNWDNYAYNKNNYVLWYDSNKAKFEFITFDTDNTFGVDWVNIDWTTRNPYKWYNADNGESRPLAYRLLNVPSCQQLFSNYLQEIISTTVNKDTLFPYLDSLQKMLAPYVTADSFKRLDYGYDSLAFVNGFVSTVDGHTPYGIKPFIEKRKAFIVPLNIEEGVLSKVTCYPNPSNGVLYISNAKSFRSFDAFGKVILQGQCSKMHQLDLSAHAKGVYLLSVVDDDGVEGVFRVLLW